MQNSYIKHKLDPENFPLKLTGVDSPPKQLFYKGGNPVDLVNFATVAIVGSRRPTPYGIEVTNKIAFELANKGIVIISGLALGVDTIAHKAVLRAGGATIAVLPAGLDKIYPSSHRQVAKQILDSGGALVSEYDDRTPPLKQNFIARNRIVAGLADIIVITEAAEKSGTLHTANFALNQGKTVMSVPGPITSLNSKGTNNLIKAGAIPLTSTNDVLFKLNIKSTKKTPVIASDPNEALILSLLSSGITDSTSLILQSKLGPQEFNQTITMLEINGQIAPLGGGHWSLL